MGINGLSKAIRPVEERASLYESASKYRQQNANLLIKIGVDMSTLMAECSAAIQKASVSGGFYGGPLRILFMKLCYFLKYPAIMVFVYDGPGRPALKRGRRVRSSPPFWTNPSMDMVQAFGYHVHQAPGEAEAELAMLNQHEILDAVISSDSDVFVFGATKVYHTIPAKMRHFDDEIAVYTASKLSSVMGLTREGLVLVALICGGDYDTVGLEGCGPTTALGLAKCGYGEDLVRLFQTFHGERLTTAIDQWRLELRKELLSNSRGHLRGKERALAESIPDSFPSLDTLSLYLEPVVSASASSHLASVSDFRHREPSLNRLVMVSSTHLGWNTEEFIKDKFKRNVWEGVFLQMLYSKFILYDNTQQILATPNIQARLFDRKIAKRTGRMAPSDPTYQARLLVSAQNFIALMNASFQSSNLDTFRVWVHMDALPERLLQELSGDAKITRKSDKSRVMFVEGSSEDSSQQAAAFPESTKRHQGGILEALDHMMKGEYASSSTRSLLIDPNVIDLTEDSDYEKRSTPSSLSGTECSIIDLT